MYLQWRARLLLSESNILDPSLCCKLIHGQSFLGYCCLTMVLETTSSTNHIFPVLGRLLRNLPFVRLFCCSSLQRKSSDQLKLMGLHWLPYLVPRVLYSLWYIVQLLWVTSLASYDSCYIQCGWVVTSSLCISNSPRITGECAAKKRGPLILQVQLGLHHVFAYSMSDTF
jgi:hypothetical protein